MSIRPNPWKTSKPSAAAAAGGPANAATNAADGEGAEAPPKPPPRHEKGESQARRVSSAYEEQLKEKSKRPPLRKAFTHGDKSQEGLQPKQQSKPQPEEPQAQDEPPVPQQRKQQPVRVDREKQQMQHVQQQKEREQQQLQLQQQQQREKVNQQQLQQERERQEKLQREKEQQQLLQQEKEKERERQLQQEKEQRQRLLQQKEKEKQQQLEQERVRLQQQQLQEQREKERQQKLIQQKEKERQLQLQKEKEREEQQQLQRKKEKEQQQQLQQERERQLRAQEEKERQQQLLQQQKEKERQKQLQQEKERQKQLEQQKEKERLQQLQREKEQQQQLQLQKEKERQRELQVEKERQRQIQQQRENERQQQLQREKEEQLQLQKEKERQKQLQQEKEKQQQLQQERERQQQLQQEKERQQQLQQEKERQQQLQREKERQQQLQQEKERQQQLLQEKERQQQLQQEKERQQQLQQEKERQQQLQQQKENDPDRKLANFFKMGVQDGAGVVTQVPPPQQHTQMYNTDQVTSNTTPHGMANSFERSGSYDADAKGMTAHRMSSGAAGINFIQQQAQVRVLTLNHDVHLDSTLFRLQKGWILQLRPGPSLLGRHVSVFTNHPETPSECFTRNRYRRLQWKSDSRNKGDDTALFVEINIVTAGSFHFYFTYDKSEDREKARGSGFFIVDPTLTVGTNSEVLPLDCIQCQTVLAKSLGPLPDWEQRLQVAYETGYNMVHLTPIQELGGSNSSYSLGDQHKLNTEFHTPGQEYTFTDVEALIRRMRDEWKMLCITDIVLNHTANESPWLQEHPEGTYNCQNSPHLRPAYLLDRVLHRMTVEVAEGKWEDRGIPVAIREEKDLEAIKNALHCTFLPQVKLHEFYTLDIDRIVEDFRRRISGHVSNISQDKEEPKKSNLVIIQDPNYGRRTCTVDMNLAVKLYNVPKESMKHFKTKGPEARNEEDRIVRCCAEFRHHLENLNQQRTSEIQAHLIQAVECCLGTVRYQRLQHDGPMIAEVSEENPLVPPYFTHYGEDLPLEEEEALMYSPKNCFLMAHNGWVMGDDPLRNFASPDSYVYLRRELVAWGDSVKLRYGEKPEDCPFLWDHMRRYCEYTARIFHGIRLDNCHSTPIHVAEYMLDAARKVRPDLYVIAELFTNSDLTDNVFVNRLGINSLIREAMSAPNSHEEGRLVYLYGGEPVGAFLLPPVRPLVPSIAHAIFLDLTHDNRSPAEVRTAWDMLPSTALVNMACCASGSNRGYDELVPHHIHVVDETRVYTAWSDSEPTRGEIGLNSGIIKGKKLLNKLHHELGANGYNQVFVDQVTEHVVTVTRHNPVTHQSVVLVAYTSFRPPSDVRESNIRPLKVQGRLEEIIFEMQLKGKTSGDDNKSYPGFFSNDSEFINGLTSFVLDVKENIQPSQASLVRLTSSDQADTTECEYTANFTPGSVIAFRLSLLPPAQSAVNKIRGVLSEFGYKSRISEVTTHNTSLSEIVNNLTLADVNRVLYRCDDEEKDEGRGGGAYVIPNHGPLQYCGLQGFISALSEIRVHNDLGHPLCCNLRDGDWMMDYIVARLKLEPGTQPLGNWFENVFTWLKEVPRYLIPAYFDSIITSVYLTIINRAWALMGDFVSQGSDFAKALGLCSVQFCGIVRSALLPQLSPNLMTPHPPVLSDSHGSQTQMSVTIAAGLPHFSTGYMRCWGRDTFIALPGNLLITGRYNEARWIILAFAGTMRHGLIPNLLDGGHKARFNCRDAVWFWLQSIQRYVTMAPEGYRILKDKVTRMYPSDDSPPQEPGRHEQLLEEVIQEALQRHFQGVQFRERNAGFQIDREMCDEGFNNKIGVDLETGFVYGGTIHNCGTWMDKMGSSELAGTKGKPATPRDGSAVEIVGLCKAALRFLGQMYKEEKFRYNAVERRDDTGNVTKWTYEFWEKKIEDNFEKFFWISEEPQPKKETNPELINRRGIYKDSFKASQFWADYQLRCNFPIAVAVAPEMTSSKHAWVALKNAEEILLGPLGIKTLDSGDWAYSGDYDNTNDSADPKIAHGYNYHQGPEWLWPVGWLLRAQLAIAPKVGGYEELGRTMSHVKSIISRHYTHLLTDPWRSLPELTNANGAHCSGSNPAQAWSTGCLLEVLWEMDHIEKGLRRSSMTGM